MPLVSWSTGVGIVVLRVVLAFVIIILNFEYQSAYKLAEMLRP